MTEAQLSAIREQAAKEAEQKLAGPYTKSLPIASVGGTLYGIDGPTVVGGLYSKTRVKKLLQQLNAAYASALVSERTRTHELIQTLVDALGETNSQLAAAWKMSILPASAITGEAIQANRAALSKARDLGYTPTQ